MTLQQTLSIPIVHSSPQRSTYAGYGLVLCAYSFEPQQLTNMLTHPGLDNISINLVQQRLAGQGIVALDESCVAVCGAALAPGQLGAAPAVTPPSAAAAAPVTG